MPPSPTTEAELLARARACDPDRALCLLFAPAEHRTELFALLLLHHELGRIAELTSRPEIGLLRLAFWRDRCARAAAGDAPDHPLLRVLAASLRSGRLPLSELERAIEARARELDRLAEPDRTAAGFSRFAELEELLAATSGVLARIMVRLIGAPEPIATAAEAAGTAFGLVGTVRAAPFEVGRPQRLPPRSLVDMLGLEPGRLRSPAASARIRAAAEELLDRARARIEEVRRLAPRPPRMWLAPLLFATVAEARLRSLRRNGSDPFAAARRDAALLPLRLLRAWLARRP
ncbi:MAG: squalene/phytoene synthase family protein [Geminicoccaceae bacterium]|nr:squalene/phytoene synthase family protein [Geminicoccaceae bacterium]